LLDSQQVNEESVLTGLSLDFSSLGVTTGNGGGKVTVGGYHQESNIGLGSTGDHVLDKVTMSRGIDDGVVLGFSEEFPMSRAYRDSRINRIYEGTNEINRLLTVDMLLKRAFKGKLDLMGPAMAVQKELMSLPELGSGEEEPFAQEKKLIAGFKKAILMTSGAAVQRLMMSIEQEQELLMNLADMALTTFAAESALLRLMKCVQQKGPNTCDWEQHIVSCFLYDAADRMLKYGKDAVHSFSSGDELRMLGLGLKRFTKSPPLNVKEGRRAIATVQLPPAGRRNARR